MTQNNGGAKENQGKIWAVSLTEDKKWTTKAWVEVKGALAKGRVSVAVHEDWFYIVWRGLNDNKVWLTRTEDFVNFMTPKAINDSFKTTQSPAVAAYWGYLTLTAVGGTDPNAANPIYWISLQAPKFDATSWVQFSGASTRRALSMTVFRNELYAFHAGADSTGIYYFKFTIGDATWTKIASTKASIISGPSSASFRDNNLYVTYRGPDGNIKWNRFDGKVWYCTNGVNWRFALGELGLVSFNTRLHLSYAEGNCILNAPPDKLVWEKMPQKKLEAPMWDSDLEDELDDLKMPSPVKSKKRRSWWSRLLCFT